MKFNLIIRGFYTILISVMLIAFPSVLNSQNEGVSAYQVIVYSAADFIGESQSFTLNRRTHRILIVNNFNKKLDNKISSIHVGSGVKAILFDQRDFHANWRSSRRGIGIFRIFLKNKRRRTPEKLEDIFNNVGVYTDSSSQVRHNDIYTSMIIIPKDIKTDWGVILFNFQDGFARIEPIPDLKRFKQRVIPDLGYINNKISAVRFLGNYPGSVKLQLFDHTQFKGENITLPGMGSHKRQFMLDVYNFKDRASSYKFIVIDPEVNTQRVSAPPADRQVFVVKKILPIADVFGKAKEPFPGKNPEVNGMWHDGHGHDYELMQQGMAFSWFCPTRDEYGAGVFLDSKRLRIIWNNPKDQGQTFGKVVKSDHKGMALEIRMDNGVTLFRK